MFNLTFQERRAVLFLGALLILGATLNYFAKRNPRWLNSFNISSECKLINKISINTALKEELISIPGIGEVMAERIVSYRNQNGPFSNIEDLKKVKGIKDKKLESIKNYIVLP